MSKKTVGALILFVVFIVLPAYVYLLINDKLHLGYNIDYEPTQPIAFSHELHAGQKKIDCTYCHTTTEVSRHASVPSVNICMNCHNQVKTESPEIQKIHKAFLTGESIAWLKVHLLPDFVKFNHSAHIRAGKTCQICHGEVEKMTVLKQKQTLSMGWCVRCHRKPENNAPTNCGTCHY